MPKDKKRKRARVNVGKDINGVAIYRWASGYTQKELNAEIRRIEAEWAEMPIPGAPAQPVPLPAPIAPPTPIFREYAWEWYNLYKKQTFSLASQTSYENALKNHLCPEFGDTRLGDLDPAELQRFILQYDEMSHSLISKIMMVLKQVCRAAVDDDILIKDPTRKMKPPYGTVGERKPLTMEAVQELIASAQGNRDGLLPMVLLFTGLRRGEALGLRWEDIRSGEIHVRRAVKFDGNHTYLGDTKTKAARRTIPINEHLAEWLGKPGKGFVFGGDTVWTQSKFDRTWERMRKTMTILEGVTAHVLRHTYTMLLRRAGVDSATAQYLLGHEDYETTANVYTHIDGLDIKEAQQKMGLLLPQLLPHV